jgi:hypothetical protein
MPGDSDNLQILFGSQTDFSASISDAPVAFDSSQLVDAPYASIPSGEVSLTYHDTFSTFASQTELIVMARDPEEYRTALESQVPSSYNNGNSFWETLTSAPNDSYEPTYGVTLPYALEIPYPVSLAGSTVSSWPLSTALFTGSSSTPFAGASAADNGSVKGLYLEQRGVCAYDVDLQDKAGQGIVDQYLAASASSIRDQIESGASFLGVTLGVAPTRVDAASFLSRDKENVISGGFVTNVTFDVQWSLPVNNANDSFNYTFVFDLNDGILDVTPTLNHEFDYGAFSGTLASKIEESFPSTIANTVYLAALAQQAQPIPNINASTDGCTQRGSQRSPECYTACDVGMDPNSWPPPLDASASVDDSSWHKMDYCRTITNLVASQSHDAAIAYGLSETDATTVRSQITAPLASDPDSFANVRCNFYPAYEAGTINRPDGGSPAYAVPTCEIVARAKRLNVFPDKVELVWFDAPDLAHVGPDEYSNEAFAIYLALTKFGSGGTLCARQPEVSFGTSIGFAHGSAND